MGVVRSVNPARRELRVTPARAAGRDWASVAWAVVALRDGTELRCRVREVRVEPRGLVVALAAGVTRDSVARCEGATVAVEAAESAAETFRAADVLGFEAVDAAGGRLGTVTDVIETGAHDVIEVTREDGATALFPALETLIVSVDAVKGQVALGDIGPYTVESLPPRGKRHHAH